MPPKVTTIDCCDGPVGARKFSPGIKLPLPGGGLIATKAVYDNGLFCVYANNDTSVLQFLPPLTLTDAEADEIIARMRRTFS